MIPTSRVILTITFISTAIWTVRANDSVSNYSYDITKTLSNRIANLLNNVKTDQIAKLVNDLENYDGKSFECDVAHDKEPFHNKFFFGAINITASRRIVDFQKPYINCQFYVNKLVIFMSKFMVQIFTDVGAVKDTVFLYFTPVLYFHNMSIFVTKLPKNNDEAEKINVNYTYDWFSVSYTFKQTYFANLTENRKFELEALFQKPLPSLLLENINTNTKFLHSMDENFLSQPGKDLNSTHPQFLTNEQQHYYFIPNIPFYWFNLYNVTIKGLWNFNSLGKNNTIGENAYTLIVKNVRGSLTLDYGCETEKPLELDFMTDTLFISVRYEYDVDENLLINETNVEARDYHVILLDTQITHRQAALIMQKIESAVALSIWPSVKTWNNSNQQSNMYESENVLETVFSQTTQKPDTKSIKQLFSKWIPFN
ncbi:uncharacterized protein LOC135837337 [Planococcus citri]|uniref:uncharacterized protein LOC135837337 n=1 Tax=Planococcus citri TaxID=170843 RepID=UPI0031F870F6